MTATKLRWTPPAPPSASTDPRDAEIAQLRASNFELRERIDDRDAALRAAVSVMTDYAAIHIRAEACLDALIDMIGGGIHERETLPSIPVAADGKDGVGCVD